MSCKNCKESSGLIYFDVELCWGCWKKYCGLFGRKQVKFLKKIGIDIPMDGIVIYESQEEDNGR